MPGVNPDRLVMRVCRHGNHSSRTRGCGKSSHVQEVYATDPTTLHHHPLDCVHEDDLSFSERGVKPKVIKLADGDQIGGEVRSMYSCFEGKMCKVAVVGKCAFNFAYTQDMEGSIFVCGVTGMWRIICKVSSEVLSTSKAMICCTGIGIGPALGQHSEKHSHGREIIGQELCDDC